MADCKSCSGSCGGSCGGCARELVLSPEEIQVLRQFGQTPFLPVARKRDDMTPVYLEEDTFSQDRYGLIFSLLEKKALISIDYDEPLRGADMSRYGNYPVHGSMALTARGQKVLEILDTQGASE